MPTLAPQRTEPAPRDLENFKTFFTRFDARPKSGIYCKAPLNTAATHWEAKEDRGDAAKAARMDQIKNLIFLTSFQKLMYTTRLS